MEMVAARIEAAEDLDDEGVDDEGGQDDADHREDPSDVGAVKGVDDRIEFSAA